MPQAMERVHPDGDIFLVLSKSPVYEYESFAPWNAQSVGEESKSRFTGRTNSQDRAISSPHSTTDDEKQDTAGCTKDGGSKAGGCLEDTQATSRSEANEPNLNDSQDFYFQVSSKHLEHASDVFKAWLKSPLGEPQFHDGRRKHSLPFGDPEALLILMNVIHGNNSKVPRSVDLELLAMIAVLVDYFNCSEAVELAVDQWIDHLRHELPAAHNRELVLWILIFDKFGRKKLLEKAHEVFSASSTGYFNALGLPISEAVINRMNRGRDEKISPIIKTLLKLATRLQMGQSRCTLACESMLLGSLLKHIGPLRLLSPGPVHPYLGHSYKQIAEAFSLFESPTWFCEVSRQSSPEESDSTMRGPSNGQIESCKRHRAHSCSADHAWIKSILLEVEGGVGPFPFSLEVQNLAADRRKKGRTSCLLKPDADISHKTPRSSFFMPDVKFVSLTHNFSVIPSLRPSNKLCWGSKQDEVLSRLLCRDVLAGQAEAELSEWDIRSLCSLTRKVLLSQPTMLPLTGPIKIIGDICGQYHSLLRILDDIGVPSYNNCLCLGNYIGNADLSIETLCLLFALKIKFPKNFFLLRGKNESEHESRKLGFKSLCAARYTSGLWKTVLDCFDCLPLAATINDSVFCVSGGICKTISSLDEIAQITRPTGMPQHGLVFDLLNSGPGSGNTNPDDADSPSSELSYSRPGDFATGVSSLESSSSDASDSGDSGLIIRGDSMNRKTAPKFDSDELSKFLLDHSLNLVFRSSERITEGFSRSLGNKLVTVFSGADFESEDKSAVVKINKRLTYAFTVFRRRGAADQSDSSSESDSLSYMT